MKILVTGATGYLGRATVARLAREGHEVVAMSRRPADIEGAAEVRIGDVLAPDTLTSACAGCEAMVHAAGLVSHHPDDAQRCSAQHGVVAAPLFADRRALRGARGAQVHEVPLRVF